MIKKRKEENVQGWDSPIAIHPGEYLRDILEDYSVTQIELAQRTNISKKIINEIVNGENPVTRTTAYKLSKVFPISADYWVNLQKIYDDDLLRLEEMKKNETEKEKYLDLFKDTYTELIKNNLTNKFRWIPVNFSNIVFELQKYFAVDSLNYIKKLNLEAAFRKYDRKKIDNYALAAWLRMGQIKAQQAEVKEFDKQKLRDSIEKIKSLSLKSPDKYLPEIKTILADCGVAIIYAPYFKNTHVQGATQWIGKNKYFIILKTSKQGEDKFWFNLFHEMGHVLYHGKKDIFINIEDGEDGNNIKQEKEADEFAQKTLIPNYDELIKDCSNIKNAIEMIAEKNKISPSIVAGRIAHEHKDNKNAWILTNQFIGKINYVDVN